MNGVDHPRPDETPVAVGEGERGQEKTKKKRQKKRFWMWFASLFTCFSRPKSTKAQGEQVTDEDPSRMCTGGKRRS